MINWCHHNLAVLLITNLKNPATHLVVLRVAGVAGQRRPKL
jgi:hypothetical protein